MWFNFIKAESIVYMSTKVLLMYYVRMLNIVSHKIKKTTGTMYLHSYSVFCLYYDKHTTSYEHIPVRIQIIVLCQ